MRSLTLARYRFLLSIRSSGTAIGGMGAVLGAAVLGSMPALMTIGAPTFSLWRRAPEIFMISAPAAGAAYLLHTLALVVCCFAFGTSQRRAEQPSSDLIETAPVTAAEAFWGDTLGIFCAGLALHATAVPLLVFTIALTAFPSTTLWLFEALVIVVLFLVSTLCAWSLRAVTWRWSLARVFRATMTVGIIVFSAAGLLARRPAGLADAVIGVLQRPGNQSWTALLHAFRSPSTATTSFVILYAAFVAFFFIHSVRRALRD